MTGHGLDRTRKTGLVVAGERRDAVGVKPLPGPAIVQRTGIGPWGGAVRVEAWQTRVGKTYRVIASWTGPALAGSAPTTETIQANDLVDVDEQERAVRVARAAIDLLSRPERPDLDALAARL